MPSRAERIAAAKRLIRSYSTDGVERRSVPFNHVTARSSAGSGAYQIVGHAAVFNSLSNDLGGFVEKIDPGAFSAVLRKNPDVRALFNHDPSLVLARTKSGTLTLAEDATGLEYRADVPAGLYYGESLRILLNRGDVDQSSFAFRVARNGDTWQESTAGLMRTIHRFSALYDISPVSFPAYDQAESGLASAPTPTRTPTLDRIRHRERKRRLEEMERAVAADIATGRVAPRRRS